MSLLATSSVSIINVDDGQAYALQPSNSVIIMNEDGDYKPSQLSFQSVKLKGTDNPSSYSGRFKIEKSSDETNWTTEYTSSSDESSTTYTIPSTIEEKTPYNFRATGNGNNVGSKAFDTIVGGTVAWNQLLYNGNFADGTDRWSPENASGASISAADGVMSVTVLNTPDVFYKIGLRATHGVTAIPSHKYLLSGKVKSPVAVQYGMRSTEFSTALMSLFVDAVANTWTYGATIFNANGNGGYTNTAYFAPYSITEFAQDDVIQYADLMLIDLTQMFGSTIADYIYSLEQSTAGAGVAWFKKLFPKDYYPYDAGSLKSVEDLQSHDTVGFNLWDEEWEAGGISPDSGIPYATITGTRIRSKNYIPVVPNAQYNFSFGGARQSKVVIWYDADKNYISGSWSNLNHETVPENARYMKFNTADMYGNTYKDDICFHLVWDGDRDGEYEPYVKHSYPLDSTLTLRGIPKLDAQDNLYYDGDEYLSDGTVNRRYGIVDLGTLSWTWNNANGWIAPFSGGLKPMANNNVAMNAICSTMPVVSKSVNNSIVTAGTNLDTIAATWQGTYLYGSNANAKPTGILIYELAEPTTETAEPYVSPQIVDRYGTEEYVTDSIVPVGHETKYTSNISSIRCSLYASGGTTTLLDQQIIPVINDAESAVYMTKQIEEYRLSDSSTSITGSGDGYEWADTMPSVPSGKYLWKRLKSYFSNGSIAYSDAVCDIVMSGLVFDVDRNSNAITSKVWESDITNKINAYDGSTGAAIRDRVTQTETSITGITSRVSDVESETDSLGTRMTSAESNITQNANNITTKVSKDGVISSINQSAEAIQISASKVDLIGNVTFSMLDSSTQNTVTKLTQNTEQIIGTQTSNTYAWTGVSHTISELYDGLSITYLLPRSVGGSQIAATYTTISSGATTNTNGAALNLTLKDGTATGNIPVWYMGVSRVTSHFGYGSSLRLVYHENLELAGSYRATGWWIDAQYNSDTVDNRIVYFTGKTGNIGIWAGSLFMRDSVGTYQNICTASDGTCTTNTSGAGARTTETTKKANPNGFEVGSPIWYTGTSYNKNTNITASNTVYSSMGNIFDSRYAFNTTLTTNSLTPYVNLYLVGTINSTDGLFYLDSIWWTQTATDTSKVYILVGGVYDSTTSHCRITLYEDNKWLVYKDGKLQEYNKVLANNAQSTANSAKSLLGTWTGDATLATTTINGGYIKTHTIESTHLATDAIMSSNYQASSNASSPYSATGAFLDLSTGNLYMPNFGVNGTTGAAYFNGTVNANAGKFGDDSSYWNIETVYDYNMRPHAALVGTGSPYLQTGNWQVSDNAVATRKYTSTSESSGNATYYKDSGTNTFYDVGMKIPSNFSAYSASDSSVTKYNKAFYYGRKYTGNNAPSLDSDWTYFFSIDSGGNVITAGDVYEGGVKLSDKYAAITDVGSAYLPKTGGTITGNLSVNGSFTTNLMLQTNLGSTSSAQLTGTANAVVKPGVTGTLGVGNGGTGKTTALDAANAFITALPTWTATPTDDTYFIRRDTGGTATYGQVKFSTLWTYINNKITSAYDITNTYRRLDDNQFDTIDITDAQIGNLMVTGAGRFTNGLYGDLIGNADTATTAATADKVGSNLVILLNSGTTEGTNKFTYNGSATKNVNITKSAIGLGNVENTALSTWAGSANLITTKVGTLAAAAVKGVDTSISAGSTSINLPTSKAVATFVEGKGYVTSSGVTSVRVQATSPVVSSVNTEQNTTLNTTISLADGYGDTKNPYGTKTKNYVLAGPTTGNAAAPTFRALVADDIPTLTPGKVGLGNVTNNKQVKGLSSGTTSGHLVSWGADGYTVADSGIAVSSVNKTVKSLASNNDGKIVLTYLDGTISDPIEVKIIGSSGSSVSYADALNVNGTAVGGAEQPVFINNQGKPQTANKIPKLNNGTTGGTFYAPTAAGTSGQFLKSNGSGAPTWVNGVTGVKGNAESSYRTGDVNITPANVGAVAKSGDTMTGTLVAASNKYYESSSTSGLNMSNSDIIGVGGIYTNDTSEHGDEGINFYRDATHWDSLYANGGNLYFAPNRPTGSNGEAQTIYTIANYGNGTTDLSIRPLIAQARANRLAFLPADQVIIQKTTDGGATWVDAGVSDAKKVALFANSSTIDIPLLNNAKSTSCGLRVIITGMKYNVPSGTSEMDKYNYWNSDYVASTERYFNVREWWFWLSSNNDTIRLEIDAATGGNSTTWRNMFNTDFGMTGWSGSDWVRAGNGATFGGGTTQTGNYWNWRLTFWSRYQNGKSEFNSNTQQSISMINCYGDSVWTTPNNLMAKDHLYTWDNNKNATFPGQITATQFNGNATSASTATKATQDGDGAVISSTYLKRSGGTMTGQLKTNGTDIILGATGTGSTPNDSGDLVWQYGNGTEKMRIWGIDSYTAKSGPNFRLYNENNEVLYTGRLPLADGTSATGTWGISITGSSASATKATQDSDGHAINTTYLKLSGGTMTGQLNLPYNKQSISFRSDNSSYDSGFVYGNGGNEALALIQQNAVTSFMVVHGSDPATWNNSTWTSASPTIQTKNKSLYVNELIANGVTPSYNFKVNGTAYLGGEVRVSHNNTDTESVSFKYNETTKSLDFIFN